MHNPFLTLTIDLSKIVYNFLTISQETGTKTASVLKADAYGVGMGPVAHALKDAGCEEFFVATLPEAMDLRALLGPGPLIFVFNGFDVSQCSLLVDHNLVPVITTLEQLCQAQTHLGVKSPLPWALHFDTGMRRLSLPPQDIMSVLKKIDGHCVSYTLTHLACADEPAHPMNERQRAHFQEICSFFPNSVRSLGASEAVNLGPAFYFDLLRVGGSLYGALQKVPGKISERLQFALKAQTSILQIQHLRKGESVGYNATYTAPQDRKIATLAAGYADGIPRSLSNKGYVVMEGHKAPILGRISMDLIVVDVTDVPAHLAQVGKWVDLIPDHMAFYEQSLMAGSAPREALTRLGHRFERIYVT